MPPSRNRRRRRSASNWYEIPVAIALIAVFFAAAVGLGYAYFSAPKKVPLDTASLCPLAGPEGVTVVLIDTTDEFPPQGQSEILGLLKDLVSELPPRYRLELRLLDVAEAKSKTVFTKCNPGDGEGLSEWTENPRLAKLKWIKSFVTPAETAIRESVRPEEAKRSPIMAAIQDIALADFSAEAVQGIQKRLVIISDMIEYTSDYGQYPKNGDLSYQRYKLSPAYKKYSTDLHGARVDINYIQRRDGPSSTIKHAEFWKDWILDNRGELGSIHRIQGLG